MNPQMSTTQTHHSNLTLVIDQGSHASRVAIFDDTGKLIYLKIKDVATQSSAPKNAEQKVEQDAHEILDSIQNLLKEIPPTLSQHIQCGGLCTQRSTIVAWHKSTGQALAPAISWRDTRAQTLINKLQPFSEEVKHISGLPLSAHYAASKMHWLIRNNAEVQHAAAEKQLCIAPLASFLLFHLLKEQPFIIDHSNAQRCQLFDIQSLNWSSTLLDLFEIPRNTLPECAPIMHNYGKLKFNNIALNCVCGDQNAALHAYPPLQKNNALVNIGTGAFILSAANERKNQPQTLIKTLCRSDAQHINFVTEGTVNSAGSALTWAQQNQPCTDLFEQLPHWLAQITSPPVFINSILNLGSPWWCDAGEPEFITPEFSNTKTPSQSEQYVAIIESIVFLIFNNIQQLSAPPETIFISGGLSILDGLCQKLADLSQANVLRFTEAESTARGCAWLACQTLKSASKSWQVLPVSQQFISHKNTLKQTRIVDRYQQFVGELNRRCNKY
ncbi:Glycerol kinase [hydrothermal vent metagenome]|uniref:Glycerol kinase n=1 Tax=hydrothermal vent metagenome TaxID=652676 RepID=A0A3B0YAZ6_9ZZZZ